VLRNRVLFYLLSGPGSTVAKTYWRIVFLHSVVNMVLLQDVVRLNICKLVLVTIAEDLQTVSFQHS